MDYWGWVSWAEGSLLPWWMSLLTCRWFSEGFSSIAESHAPTFFENVSLTSEHLSYIHRGDRARSDHVCPRCFSVDLEPSSGISDLCFLPAKDHRSRRPQQRRQRFWSDRWG